MNLGSLGFLTDVPLSSLFPMLDAIAQGERPVEQRSLMQCDLLRGDEVRGSYLVFNDAVVNKTALARLNNYDLFVDKAFVSSYRADGMIVATPTGSTAYSLSAGGPVVMPTVERFCDYSRGAAFADASATCGARFSSDRDCCCAAMRKWPISAWTASPASILRDGDRVRCRRSEHRVSLFRTDADFFHVLRTKLKWGER